MLNGFKVFKSALSFLGGMLAILLPIPTGGAQTFGVLGLFAAFCGAATAAFIYYLHGSAWLGAQFRRHGRLAGSVLLLGVLVGAIYLCMWMFIDTPAPWQAVIELVLRSAVSLPIAFGLTLVAALIVDRFWP